MRMNESHLCHTAWLNLTPFRQQMESVWSHSHEVQKKENKSTILEVRLVGRRWPEGSTGRLLREGGDVLLLDLSSGLGGCIHFVKILQVYSYDLCTFQDVYYFLKRKQTSLQKREYAESNSQGSNPDPLFTKFVTGQIIWLLHAHFCKMGWAKIK